MEENKVVVENNTEELIPIVIEETLPVEEEVKQDVQEVKIENTMAEVKEEKPKKKRNIFVRILNLLAFLLLTFVVFETVIAFLNFNMIRQNKEPNLFVTKTKETRGEYDYTIYDMGLYRIIRKEDLKNYEIRMLPFFLDM